MREVAFAIPGDVDTVSGGYAYDRRLIAELPGQGWTVRHLPLADDFPAPSAASLDAAEAAFAGLPDGTVLLVDGLALAVLPEAVRRHGERLAIVALVHHPLALETGLDPAAAERLAASERQALAPCRHVVVTSPETARLLTARFGVEAERISVAVPGTEPGPVAAGGNSPPHLVSVATLIPRKGHDVLVEALGRIAHLEWHASFVGGKTADPAWAARLRADIARLGLGDRIALTGPRPDARAIMARADVFVLASRYEGYGMAFAEAMAQGLPVVACAAGAVPDLVPASAGILVPVDDAGALAEALASLILDPQLRGRLAAGALEVGRSLPGWLDTAAIVAVALEKAAAT